MSSDGLHERVAQKEEEEEEEIEGGCMVILKREWRQLKDLILVTFVSMLFQLWPLLLSHEKEDALLLSLSLFFFVVVSHSSADEEVADADIKGNNNIVNERSDGIKKKRERERNMEQYWMGHALFNPFPAAGLSTFVIDVWILRQGPRRAFLEFWRRGISGQQEERQGFFLLIDPYLFICWFIIIEEIAFLSFDSWFDFGN